MMDSQIAKPDSARGAAARRHSAYATLRRWHFYAGLLCIPIIIWLAVTGAAYLFGPQVQTWLDKPYAHVAAGMPLAAPAAIAETAVAAVPGSVLHSFQLPQHDDDATQVLVGQGAKEYRAYIQPSTLGVFKVVGEEHTLMRVLFHVHGDLLLGDKGSIIVELADAWAMILIATGLYLWWPRERSSMAGVFWPRLRHGGRVFWRDMHAVTGVWLSASILFLLVSALPWTATWGAMLKNIQQWQHGEQVQLDWSTGNASDAAKRQLLSEPPTGRSSQSQTHYASLNPIVRTVKELHFAPPVLISPPSAAHAHWTAQSEASNRTLRAKAVLDEQGHLLSRQNFSQGTLINRIVGVGVAAHIGQLFGWANLALGVLTDLGLILLCISAIRLWWKRRPLGTLGAPTAEPHTFTPVMMIIVIATLGVVIPLLGASLIFVLVVEKLILKRVPYTRQFLGLSPPRG